MGYRHGSHTVFEIHLHVVWVTKYRKPVLTGQVGIRVRELIWQVCRDSDVEILKGHISKDHFIRAGSALADETDFQSELEATGF